MSKSEIWIPIALFAMVYGIVYLMIRKKERMALLQKGADASVFDAGKQPSSLKWGIVLVGIGIGILVGKLLSVYTIIDEEPATFSMICLFGGIGLVIYHWLGKKFE
jgi:uncharacterized oligopeptide transporter (OPT) family protein